MQRSSMIGFLFFFGLLGWVPTPDEAHAEAICDDDSVLVSDLEDVLWGAESLAYETGVFEGPAPAAGISCENTCGPGPRRVGLFRTEPAQPGAWAGDGECDDGGPGSAGSGCALGTDCTDCGARGCDETHPCGDGEVCEGGSCVYDLGEIPERCFEEDLPEAHCDRSEGDCDDLLPFDSQF